MPFPHSKMVIVRIGISPTLRDARVLFSDHPDYMEDNTYSVDSLWYAARRGCQVLILPLEQEKQT